MICKQCGAVIPDGAAFCQQCGSEIPAAGTAQPVRAAAAGGAPIAKPAGEILEKVKGNKKLRLGIIGGAAVIVAAVIILIIASNSGGGAAFDIRQNGYRTIYTGSEEPIYFYNGAELNKSIDEPGTLNVCADGSAACVISDGTLFYCKGTDVKSVADDVSNSAISDDGSTVAFVSDGEIKVYDGSTKTVDEIDDDESVSSLSLSPDGSALIYSVYDGDYKCYGWNGGEPVKLGSCSSGYVSNGGGVFFGITDKGKLIMIKNLDDSTKDTLGSCDYIPYITADHRSVIFRSGTKYRVYDPSFDEAKSLPAGNMELASAKKAINSLTDVKNFVIYSDSRLYKVYYNGEDYEKDILAKNVDSYMISADGKTIVYRRNDTLYRISALTVTDEPEVLAEDIRFFAADSSLSNIYCTSFDDEFLYVKGNGKTEKVESDVPDNFSVLENGTCIYALDGDFKYSTGGKGTRCDGIGEADEDMRYYSISANTVYGFSDGYVYTSADGKKFTNTKVEYTY